jgi:2-dehydropantoate 2-reductase
MPDFPFARIDYLFVAVKSYATGEALELFRPQLEPDSTVISLQNGLGHIEPLVEIVGSSRLVLGMTIVGVNCPEEGKVKYVGGANTLLGALSDSGKERVPAAVELLKSTGFDVRADDNIMARIWEKLIVNAAINPLTALHDVPNKKVGKDKKLRTMALEILDEALKVARHEGIDLDFESMKEKVFSVARETGDNISSMLQDVRAGRRTEIEAINGAILRIAGQHRIPCPVNEKILADVLDLTRPKATEDVPR